MKLVKCTLYVYIKKVKTLGIMLINNSNNIISELHRCIAKILFYNCTKIIILKPHKFTEKISVKCSPCTIIIINVLLVT